MFVCFSFMMQICSYIPTTLPKTDPLMVPLKSSQLSTSFVLETFIHAKEKVTYKYNTLMWIWWIIIHSGIYRSYRNLSVCLSVHISQKRNSSWTDEPILMKLYTVVVYSLRMCMKERISDLNKLDLFNLRGFEIAFYVSYILSKTMFLIPMERVEQTIPTIPNT